MEPGVEYLLEASTKLKCSMEVTARALVLYHNFMRCITGVEYDHMMVAAASLNLSSRVCEEALDIEMIILTFHKIANKAVHVLSPDTETFALLRKSLITVDYVMQRMLEFTLNYRLAHQYLVPYLSAIHYRSQKLKVFHVNLNDTCIRYISDFYTSRKCLNYNPEHIAIACIDAALDSHGFYNNLDMPHPWYKFVCQDLTEEKLRFIRSDLHALYKDNEETKIIVPSHDENSLSSISSNDIVLDDT